MTPYFNDIEIYVNANFTTALGYDNAFRTALTLFLDTYIVPVVDPELPSNEHIVAITNALKTNSPTNYYLAVGDFKLKLYTACEFTVNLVIGDNAPEGNVKSYVAILTQAGTAAPVAVINDNDLLGALTWARSSAGVYTATSPEDDFPDPDKCIIRLNGLLPDQPTSWKVQFVSTKIIRITTYEQVLDFTAETSVMTATDELLFGSTFTIHIYP